MSNSHQSKTDDSRNLAMAPTPAVVGEEAIGIQTRETTDRLHMDGVVPSADQGLMTREREEGLVVSMTTRLRGVRTLVEEGEEVEVGEATMLAPRIRRVAEEAMVGIGTMRTMFQGGVEASPVVVMILGTLSQVMEVIGAEEGVGTLEVATEAEKEITETSTQVMSMAMTTTVLRHVLLTVGIVVVVGEAHQLDDRLHSLNMSQEEGRNGTEMSIATQGTTTLIMVTSNHPDHESAMQSIVNTDHDPVGMNTAPGMTTKSTPLARRSISDIPQAMN